MRRIVLLAVVALIVVATGVWIKFRTGDALAETGKPPVMMTGAKGLPTSHDDYDIVVY
jgi:hypothetical protein